MSRMSWALREARHERSRDLVALLADESPGATHVLRVLRLVQDAARAVAARLSIPAEAPGEAAIPLIWCGDRDATGPELEVALRTDQESPLALLTLVGPPLRPWTSEDWAQAEDWSRALLRELYAALGTHIVVPAFGARPSNDQLVSAIERADDGMVLVSASRRVEWVNDAFLRILELPREEVEGVGLAELQQRYPTLGVLRDLDASCEMGLDTAYERMRGRRSGERIWVSVAFTVTRDADGEPTHFVAIARDVTEARERELQLRRLSTAIHASSEGLALVDDARVFAVANLAFARLHGLDTVEQVLGRSWFDLLSPSCGLERLHDIEFAIESSTTWTGAFDLARPDGAVRVVRHAMTRLADGGWIIGATDVTEQREIERTLLKSREQAEATSRAQADFVSLVSHELRTPLNAIIGFSNVLMKKAQDPDPSGREYLTRIHANGRQLLSIVDGILTHARASEGRLALHAEPVELGRAAQEAADEVQAERGKPEVAFHVAVPSRPCWARVDAMRWRQVVTLLVDNAIKFTPSGAVQVTVAEQPDGSVSLRVADTGIGITPERLGSIFRPFEQGTGGTTRVYGGTGLGLPIAKALCALMEMGISVESTPGAGSTFSVQVPVSLRCEAPAAAPPAA